MFLLLFLVGFVLFFFWKTPGFLLSPILQHVGIANQRQNVLMTVRASSVHGMCSKKKWYKKAGMLTLRRCWHWQTISFILSMLTQHHGNGFAGKRRAWLRYGTPSTGYIGGKIKPMCEMNQCWGSSEALAVQLALNFLDWYQRAFLATSLQLDNTGIGCCCMEMLAFGSNAILATWKEDALAGSISMRSTAESRGSGRGVSPFHLSPGCIRGVGFGLVLFWVFFLVGFLGLHLGFLHGICLEPIGLLLHLTTDV